MAPEVRRALDRGAPVVALESGIIAHGFPRPENLNLGRALEREVREAGALPATVAVLDGEVRIGLTADEMERLAAGDGVAKCSLRDLPYLCASGGSGATTVAATVRLAAQAGLAVFATGGIGGVHRRGGGPPDVSADLYALAQTSLAVISAGAKSILDLPATLELLESLGVAVIGYRCDQFPAFHAAESGLELKYRVEDIDGLAAVARAKAELGLGGALLVCNPPPPESAMEADEVEALVEAAHAEAEAEGVGGADLTPYLLAALDRLSEGRTRTVNWDLAQANARLGGQLAAALAAGG